MSPNNTQELKVITSLNNTERLLKSYYNPNEYSYTLSY